MEKNNYKILSTIFAIIFVVIFSLFNFDEYKEFHQNKTKETQNKIELTSQIENFELKDVKELKDVQFYYTPYKILLTNIIKKVDNSKKEIFLETYMLTEKKIQASLIKAHKR